MHQSHLALQWVLFGGFRKRDFHNVQNLNLISVDQYWSHIGCLFYTIFKMERQTLRASKIQIVIKIFDMSQVYFSGSFSLVAHEPVK